MGLYYEHHGQVRISHLNWNLITYLDLGTQASRYHTLLTQAQATSKACTKLADDFKPTEIGDICKQFLRQFRQATLPHLYEIETNHRSMMLSIGYNDTDNSRVRRGVFRTFGRLANVLHGVYTKLDLQIIYDKVFELATSKAQNINYIHDSTRIIRTELDKLNNTLQNITEHQRNLESNIQYLQNQLTESIVNINTNTLRTKLLEQIMLFDITLNQYAYETQNLIAIINAALDGKIHTSVFTPETLIRELKEIKMNLPLGTALPIEIHSESMMDYFRISEITIFHQADYLIFTISIPLISTEWYSIYHPIPIPIPYNQKTLILISPEIDYLAKSNDDEKFFTLRLEQWESCLKFESYKICKGHEPIFHRSSSRLCELSLLDNPQNIPETCIIKLVSLETAIWHRLSSTNSWIYYTKPDFCTTVCSDTSQNSRFEISGVGRITIPEFCEIHTENYIFMPLHKNLRNVNFDIVPENYKNNILDTLTETLKVVNPQNLTNIDVIKDLNYLAQKSMNIKDLIHRPSEFLIFLKAEFHVVILYHIVMIVIFINVYVIFKYKNELVRMYSPEIPELEIVKRQVEPLQSLETL